MAHGTGILEVKFTNPIVLQSEILSCSSRYDDQLLIYDAMCRKLRDVQSEVTYYGSEIDDAIYYINEQIKDCMEKRDAIKEISVACFVNAEYMIGMENKIAERLDENWGEFCDDNGIEYDDPEEWSIGEGLSDLWDGVCSVYEKYEAWVDFVIDAALVVVAVVGAIVAVGAFVVTGGVFAGLVVAAACFALYDSMCNFAASTLALGYTIAGNEEEAAIYLEIRDGNAGRYVFVETAKALNIDEKWANGFYTFVSAAACVINIADMGRNLVNIGKNIPQVFKDAGKGWKGVKAVSMSLCKPNSAQGLVDDAMEMFSYSKGLEKLGIMRDVDAVVDDFKYIKYVDDFAKYFDNFRGYIEADNCFKGGKEFMASVNILKDNSDMGDISEALSKFFETGNVIYEGVGAYE